MRPVAGVPSGSAGAAARSWVSLGLVGVVALALLVPLRATAFRLLKNSVTKEELRWGDGQNDLTRNTCSISSDARLDLYFSTIERWNEIGGLRNMFEAKYQDAANICVVRKGNSRNQVAVVDRDEIDGAAGKSKKLYFGRFLTEDDVFIAEDMGTTGPDDPANFRRSDGGAAGRNTLLHEFGHSIGLDHDDSQHAIMQSFVLRSALAGFPEFSSLYPDDIAGARKHYSGGSSERNLIPSWQVFYDNLPEPYQDRFDTIIGPPAEALCSGQRFLSYNASPQVVNEDDGDCDSGPRAWTVFNPDPGTCGDPDTSDACQDFTGDGGPPATAGLDGVNEDDEFGNLNRIVEICPGDTLNVPFTVVERRSGVDPVAHRTVLLAGTLDAEPGDLTRTFADAVVEIDHDADGPLVTRVPTIQLQMDTDCWEEDVDYAVWVDVDHCREVSEETESGDSGEGDNLIRTDVRFRVKSPADCGLVDDGDDSCSEFFIEDCEGGGNGGEPPGYALCADQGLDPGECAGGPCAPVNRLGNNENAALDWQSDWFADGNFAFDQYCSNFTADGEMVCIDDDGFGVCERCGIDTMLGCSCDQEDVCNDLGEGLGCFGEEFGVGFCWDLNDGPPVFQCFEGNCETLGDRFQNDPYYCSQEIDEGLPRATCIPWNCPRPTAISCGAQGLICDDNPVQVDDCALQCLGNDDCSEALGWPFGTVCNFSTDQCATP